MAGVGSSVFVLSALNGGQDHADEWWLKWVTRPMCRPVWGGITYARVLSISVLPGYGRQPFLTTDVDLT